MPDGIGRALDDWLSPRLVGALLAVLFALSAWDLLQTHEHGVELGRLTQLVDDRGARGDERYNEIRGGFAGLNTKLDALVTLASGVAVLQTQMSAVQQQLGDLTQRLNSLPHGAAARAGR